MKLILAVDLKEGMVVHGKSGNRDEYRPLTWGLSPSAEPFSYISSLRPKYLYVADLDRIAREGEHTEIILKLGSIVSELYVDRGVEIPEEYLPKPIITIVGTETIDAPFEEFNGGFLSIDIKDNRVVPSGEKPEDYLKNLSSSKFDGFILLNISSVGTERGINPEFIQRIRNATDKPLYYGGGIASMADLMLLNQIGCDGVILSTAVHKKIIPLELIQKGELCSLP